MSQYFIKNGEEYEEATAFSQDDVNGIVEKRLERERAKYSDYDDLKEKVANFQNTSTDYDAKLADLTAQNSELQSKLAKAELNAERVKVISEYGIKADLEEFITGNTVEEMRERAEKLARSTTAGAMTMEKTQKPEPKQSWEAQTAKALFGSNNQ